MRSRRSPSSKPALLPLLAVACLFAFVLSVIAQPHASATSSSPNGPIVWTTRVTGTDDDDIWMMDADGSNQHALTNNSVSDNFPSISPDRSKVAFVSYRQPDGSPGSPELYVMNSDGTGQTALTDCPDPCDAWERGATWSADSTTIAWARSDGDIWTINADGTNAANLTNTPYMYESWPEYSRDGTKLAFSANGHFDGDPLGTYSGNEIFRMNADGTNRQQLTTTGVNSDPTWSPDGSKIAFYSESTIWTMNADGTNASQLTQTGYTHGEPAWSPDGTRLAASFAGQTGPQIVAIAVVDANSVTPL